ncbi:hypothetical protein JCM8097_007420 [Rhodosporidiobolus ruineniae]
MAFDAEAAAAQTSVVLVAGYFILELLTYVRRFPNDRLGFKILAGWLAFLAVFYYAVRLSGEYLAIDCRLRGEEERQPTSLSLMSLSLTSLVEATVEGFFCWRLSRVTKKVWMRAVAFTLWTFSTSAHIAWVVIAGLSGHASVNDPKQLLVVQLAFWGTFAEGSFVAGALLYELQFATDRKVIQRSANSTLSQLVSLAMRTSGILVVFELLVAIAVSIRSQPKFAISTEVEFAAALYTLLAIIVVLYTLNYRSVMRASGPSGPVTAPSLRAAAGGAGGGGGFAPDATAKSSTSGFNGSGGRRGRGRRRAAEAEAEGEGEKKPASAVGGGGEGSPSGPLGIGLGLGLGGIGEGLNRLGSRLSSSVSAPLALARRGGGGANAPGPGGPRADFGTSSLASAAGAGAGRSRRGSNFVGQISVQTVSHVEETTVALEDLHGGRGGDGSDEGGGGGGLLGPTAWRVRTTCDCGEEEETKHPNRPHSVDL